VRNLIFHDKERTRTETEYYAEEIISTYQEGRQRRVKKTAQTEAAGCGLCTARYYGAYIEKMDKARYMHGKYDSSVL
jgi:hypothetical protein